MKQLIHNYSINLANSEIILNDFTQVYLDRLRLITDVTTNTILYNFADSAVASIVSLGTKSFYLNTLPATVATLDALEIDYETLSGDPVYDAGQRTMANSRPVVLPSDQILSANVSLQGTPNVSFAAGATVTANQGTNPWLTNASIVGVASVNASIQGTVPISGIPGAGSTLTAYQGGGWGVNASIIGTPGVNASIQGTIPVSGTFWQAIQSVSGNVNVTVSGNVPVSGTFWQTNQAVTASIAGNIPVTASIAGIVTVAGNFSVSTSPTVTALQGNAPWSVSQAAGSTLTAYQGGPWVANVSVQGTVPVSGSFALAAGSTVAAQQLGAPWLVNASVQGTIPVSGSFWQANQPVSASIAGTVPVSGTFWQATQPISGSVGLTAGTTITAYQGAGPWTVSASIAGTIPVSGTFWQATQPISGNVGLIANTTLTAYQGGTWAANVSLQGTPNIAFAAGATVTANQGTSPWIVQDNFAQTAPSIATWTAATTINTALAVTCTDYSSAIITFVGTGSTFSAGVITFEVYDGANWFGLQAARANQYTVDSTYTLGVTTQAWELDVGGWQQVRVRLSTAITGTGSPTALITMIVQGAAADPSVIVGQAVASQLQTTAALATGSTLTAYQGGAWNANVSMVGPVNISPSAGGGWNSFQVSALASTVSMSAAAGKFGGYMVMNLNAAPAYLQVFDLTSNVTLGLTVPTAVLPLPANATAANGLAANLELTAGMKLANGLKVGATTTATGATPVSTGIIGTFWYV